jgi:hypothetical protein
MVLAVDPPEAVWLRFISEIGGSDSDRMVRSAIFLHRVRKRGKDSSGRGFFVNDE